MYPIRRDEKKEIAIGIPHRPIMSEESGAIVVGQTVGRVVLAIPCPKCKGTTVVTRMEEGTRKGKKFTKEYDDECDEAECQRHEGYILTKDGETLLEFLKTFAWAERDGAIVKKEERIRSYGS